MRFLAQAVAEHVGGSGWKEVSGCLAAAEVFEFKQPTNKSHGLLGSKLHATIIALFPRKSRTTHAVAEASVCQVQEHCYQEIDEPAKLQGIDDPYLDSLQQLSDSYQQMEHFSNVAGGSTETNSSMNSAAGEGEKPVFKETVDWPVPLSPIAGEQAKNIEFERAMVAEAAKEAGPAFCQDDVLYEDDWLLVINKPCGVYSGHVLASVSGLLTATSSAEVPVHLHLANRLDRDTSGVLVITKCKRVAGKLTLLFQKRRVRKTYIGLCIGPSPTWDEILVESGHGRSRWGAWRVYAKADIGRKLPEKAVVRDMATRFKVLSINGTNLTRSQPSNGKELERVVAGSDQNSSFEPFTKQPDTRNEEVLIRAYPSTGRTHQIRLHCQFLGLPLRGDVKYGGPHDWKGINYDAHALHAESMSFDHPITAKDIHFFAPLPGWVMGSCRELIEAFQVEHGREKPSME